jgi:hypothetical protein
MVIVWRVTKINARDGTDLQVGGWLGLGVNRLEFLPVFDQVQSQFFGLGHELAQFVFPKFGLFRRYRVGHVLLTVLDKAIN